MQRGSSGGQVAAVRQTSEQRIPPCASSTHNPLAQLASPVHGAPATPVPRGPATHDTPEPLGSWLTHACVGGQS